MTDEIITPTTTEQPASWFAGADTETLGYLQNRGWDKLPADKAANEAVKAHREAEKLLGVSQEQLVRLPKDAADVAGWNAVHKKLGVPEKPEEYDISGAKFSDGKTLGEKEVAALQQIASELKLPKASAALLAQHLIKIAEAEGNNTKAEFEAKMASETENLKKNWGSNFSAHKLIAEETMKKFGIPPEAVTALAEAAGYAATMEAFRNIGVRTGEDKFIISGDRSGGLMTKDEANYKMSQLQNDRAWYTRFSNGDAAANREFSDLTKIIAGV